MLENYCASPFGLKPFEYGTCCYKTRRMKLFIRGVQCRVGKNRFGPFFRDLMQTADPDKRPMT